MYQSKHITPKTKKKAAASCRKRRMALILSLVLILTAVIGGTAAYFIDSALSISHFSVGEVSCSVAIAEDNSSVTVTNTGNVPACVRVAVVANWVNDDGIHYTQPTLTCTSDDWTKNDGIYYYNSVVPVDGYVTLSFTSDDTAPDGYTLQIQALAEAIQENAAAEAWGFSPSGN